MSNIHLPGSYASFFISQQLKKQHPIAIIAKNATHARIILQETVLFLPPDHPFKMAFLPSWELLPYDRYSPCSDITSERLKTLSDLIHGQIDLLILTPESMMLKLPPKSFIQKAVTKFHLGETINRKQLSDAWLGIGYNRVNQTQKYGEFSMRGSVIDVFPQGSKHPIRLDLFDDEIHSIRTFHSHSQLSIKKITSIEILPLHEFDPIHQSHEDIIRRAQRIKLKKIPDAILNQETFQGSIFYLPLYHEHTATIWDYLHPEWSVFIPDDLSTLIEHETTLIYQQFDASRHVSPDSLWSFTSPAQKATLTYTTRDSQSLLLPKSPDMIQKKAIICSSIPSGRTSIEKHLEQKNLPVFNALPDAIHHSSPTCFFNGNMSAGFIDQQAQIAIIPESIFINEANKRKPKKPAIVEDSWDELSLLKTGDYCIHPNHGLGKFIETCQLDTSCDDFLKIQYANGGHIFVNIQQAHILKPYLTPKSDVKLDILGSKSWEKRKQRAKKNIEQVAASLIATYSAHKKVSRSPLPVTSDFDAFCEAFPFKPTTDQEKATLAITEDAKSPHPVNRLLCADVGFGKTEIMMRGSYIYASNHKQVLVLAPTTLLAEQHFETFTQRFKDQAIQIEVLSRQKTKSSTQSIIQRFNDHHIDILIGTHKLLHQKLTTTHIDLVIIDEEHRFGVRQKNIFMQTFPNANFMNVSATPIPRSLGMAFGNMLKLLLMTTPPPKRFAVNTELHPFSSEIIQNAILRETHRQGQVFYVLNRIGPLERRLASLEEQMPQIKFGIIHGQMPGEQIKNTMRQFTQGAFDVLLSTAIIESGIDIPNANTLIIERADLFGTAQLHQLRGRVGRSHHAAYTYLLIDESEMMTSDAENRLQAIIDNQGLGDGYRLATQDMELRGVGEMLGEKQSGHIRDIGYGTYIDLLNEALNDGENLNTVQRCQINTHDEGNIDKISFHDFNERIKIYRQLAMSETVTQIDELERQMIDRSGMIPKATQTLLTFHRMQLNCHPLGIDLIDEKAPHWIIHYRSHQLIPHAIAQTLMKNIGAKVHGPKSLSLCQKQYPSLESVSEFLREHQ
ncbi:helicase-related protein [Gammaproteobacteria bacterium]|nr:helicase-related protein [Gammaproteobacteria bacterium]